MEDTNPNYTALITMGLTPDIAEALDERGVTAAEAKHLSSRELMEHFLEWNGFIGFTDTIVEAVDVCREVATGG